MSNSNFSTSRWLVELTKTFLRGAPISTPVSVITTLISQVSMMLAFLMPLKVVMLLGSDGVPKFFPKAMLGYDRNTLILSLVALSITFYFLSIIFSKISKRNAERGAKKLVANTQKIIIFENQDNLASNAYTKYIDALAGLIFSLITIGFFTVFYFDIAVLITTFLPIAYLVAYVLYSSGTGLRVTINKKPQIVTSTISNIAFMLIFLYVVVDFLYLDPPGFIIALATIILSRQMLSKQSITAAYLCSLKKDERKINAIFFHSHTFFPSETKQHQSIWSLLNDEILQTWLKLVLKEATENEIREISVKWRQTRSNGIIALQVEVIDKTFLVKLFEAKISTQARHESTLLVEMADRELPCPPLLLTTMVEKYHCHVFDITGYNFLPWKEADNLHHELNKQLLMVSLPRDLVERYRRSKPLIWERVDSNMTARLSLVASKKERQLLQNFESSMPEIKTILQSLPLCIVNHKQDKASLLISPENRVVSFHWPAWKIEPAGSSFDMEKSIEMAIIIAQTSKYRTELSQHPVQNYQLASLLASFEQAFQKQQYNDAISLISNFSINPKFYTAKSIE